MAGLWGNRRGSGPAVDQTNEGPLHCLRRLAFSILNIMTGSTRTLSAMMLALGVAASHAPRAAVEPQS